MHPRESARFLVVEGLGFVGGWLEVAVLGLEREGQAGWGGWDGL